MPANKYREGTIKVQVWMNEKDKALMKAQAEKLGLNLSAYIRMVGLAYTQKH